MAIVALAFLAAVGSAFLPNSAYEKYQLLDGTIYESLRWAYERAHFDPRPIDVAIVGPSTSTLGLSAPRIEADLARAGKPAQVANFSIIAAGRNVEWAIVDEVFKVKRPKIIVIAVDDSPHPWGHPAFKYVAPAEALAFEPTFPLHNYVKDLAYLPFRQLELFAAWIDPAAFGLTDRFDPVRYARFPTDFTVSHGMRDGQWVDMNLHVSGASLTSEARRREARPMGVALPGPLARITLADDSTYTRQIVREATVHKTRIIFVYMPRFHDAPEPPSLGFYRQFGPVVELPGLSTNAAYYHDWAHLNHDGAMALSDRLAQEIAADF